MGDWGKIHGAASATMCLQDAAQWPNFCKSSGIFQQAVKPLSGKIITEIFSAFFYQTLSNFVISSK
jgi:hypothetical protein